MRTIKATLLQYHERALVVFFVTAFALLVLAVVTTQATTIGTNITVTGNASSTAATSTAYLYVGPDGTEHAAFNFTGGDLFVADMLNVAGLSVLERASATSATTTAYLYVGPDGSENAAFNFTGGDLFVADVLNVAGRSLLSTASATSATTTAYLYVGPDGIESGSFDFTGGDLFVAGELNIGGVATTSGDLFVSGGTIGLTKTGGVTTTDGLISQNTGTATSTISAGIATGASATDSGGCIELVQKGIYYRCVIDDALTGLVCAAARCAD